MTPIDLPGGDGAVRLDFTSRDYELILYASVTVEPDTARTFAYTVTGPSSLSKLVAHRGRTGTSPIPDRDRLEQILRSRERRLADRARSWRMTPDVC